MKRAVAVVGAVLALMAPAVAHGSAGDASEPTPRVLTKNQKIALLALDSQKAAVSRYANFLASKPARINAITSRVECVYDRILENGNFDPIISQDPVLSLQLTFSLQYSYWWGYMYRILPRTTGRFSARAIKGIFLSAANSAAKLKPDLTGERIVRGLRAQAAMIDLYRGFSDIRACAVLDDWAANGYDTPYLKPFVDLYTVVALKLSGSTASSRLTAAVEALKTVPGITSSEANGFNRKLVDDSFEAILLPLVP